MKLPLKDEQTFIDSRGRTQVVGGSIKAGFWSEEYQHDYCWTFKGDWFRRSDGVEVTGAFRDESNNPVTISEAYHLKNKMH